MAHLPASNALSHIRVIDLTRVRSGPTAVRQLADWGADVIKVEAPESVEPDGALSLNDDHGGVGSLFGKWCTITDDGDAGGMGVAGIAGGNDSAAL